MELLQLKYFCDAASTQNFSETARKFLVPTSNISQSVGRLEKELGCELFEHRANKIILNDNGKLFLSHASRALSLLRLASEELAGTDGELAGEIRIICKCNRRLLTKAIESFSASHPKAKFSIRYEANAEREFDIFISDICPFEYAKRELLVKEQLFIAKKASGGPVCSSAKELLKNSRLVAMSTDSSLYAILSELCRSLGISPDISVLTEDPFHVIKYVELGLGAALVPSYSWRDMFSDGIELIPVDGLYRSTYAFIPSFSEERPIVQGFMRSLLEASVEKDDGRRTY